MKKLLPQANSLSTVIDVFIYVSTMNKWTLNDVADFCKFDVRQSSYYINACYYLSLLNEDGTLSEEGKSIISNPSKIKEKVYQRVISDSLVSKVFARLLVEGESGLKEFAINTIKDEYPEYSDAVIERRSSTLINWCIEIRDFIVKK